MFKHVFVHSYRPIFTQETVNRNLCLLLNSRVFYVQPGYLKLPLTSLEYGVGQSWSSCSRTDIGGGWTSDLLLEGWPVATHYNAMIGLRVWYGCIAHIGRSWKVSAWSQLVDTMFTLKHHVECRGESGRLKYFSVMTLRIGLQKKSSCAEHVYSLIYKCNV